MKKNKHLKIILILASSIVLIALLISIFLTRADKKTYIAFYNVPENVEAAVLNTLKLHSRNEFTVTELNNSVPLSTQVSSIKKYDLLFVTQDCDTLEVARQKFVKPVSQDFLSNMPSTIMNSVPGNNQTISYVPILYDFYQIDVNYDYFTRSKIEHIDYFEDLENVLKAEKNYVPYSFVFDGNDDVTLIDFIGALCEAEATAEEYNQILNTLYEAYKADPENYSRIPDALTELENSPVLKEVIRTLKMHLRQKTITSQMYQLKKGDSLSYAENLISGMNFIKLSDHRKINNSVVSSYKTIYMPSFYQKENRKFCAPETAVMCLKKNKTNLSLIKYLSETDQTYLSTYAGTAPVNKQCTPADVQASDVRYWLAASSGPLLPLSAALPDKQSKYITANALRAAITQN